MGEWAQVLPSEWMRWDRLVAFTVSADGLVTVAYDDGRWVDTRTHKFADKGQGEQWILNVLGGQPDTSAR